MKRALFLSLILFFCFALRADRLDDVARQLDLLEKEYWRAQRSSDGEYHKSVEKRLLKFKVDVYRIIDQLRKVRKHHLVRFDEALNVLVGNFGRIRPLVIQAFRFDFKGTAMSDYTRDYREYLKDKEEASEEEQGDKKERRSKRRYRKALPTLSNVDFVEYERWIAERVAANLEAFSRSNSKFWKTGSKVRYKGFASNEAEKVHDCVTRYMDAIRKLRIGFVKVRQQVKIEFK